NREAAEAIVRAFPGKVQLGGGIRTPADVAGWIETGVARIVIGTAALKDPQFVKDMAREYAGAIVVAVDARDGMVATDGWAEVSDVSIVDMARRFEDAGVASLLFTDIGRDGMLKGVNIDATVGLARQVDIPVIASGGVKGLIDIDTLARFAGDGIEGVITGRALYDGRLDLAAALRVAKQA
ncbi:1-(5-phosphoribosyl)-5-((5-phosphoribosylamino)methylideneamino)imidazole-4-carboxamide isomerase, partial [Erythrobacter sp. HI0028]